MCDSLCVIRHESIIRRDLIVVFRARLKRANPRIKASVKCGYIYLGRGGVRRRIRVQRERDIFYFVKYIVILDRNCEFKRLVISRETHTHALGITRRLSGGAALFGIEFSSCWPL